MSMDTNKIVEEWFYRLPKGYALAPYTDQELKVLNEVLNENGLSLDEDVDILDQAFLDAKPVKEAVSDEEFIPYLTDIMSKEAMLAQAQVNTILATYEKLSEKEKEDFQNNLRKQNLNKFISSGWKVYEKFFAPIGETKGLGRGEMQILLAVDDTETGGTGKKDIVMKGGGMYEVKELTKNFNFDPAKDGMATKFELTYTLQDFYRDTVSPMREAPLGPDLFETLKPLVEESSLDSLQKLVDTLQEYFIPIPDEKIRIFREVSYVPMSNMYEGFVLLNEIFYKSKLDTDVQDSRVTVKSKGDQDTFWISGDDADKISKASGKPDTISINVGDEIDDENKNAMIWLKRLERHPFVQDPNKMVQEFNNITRSFFQGVKGLIWYYLGNPKPNLSSSTSDWVITHVTRGNYRFALKEKLNTSKYKYLAVQG